MSETSGLPLRPDSSTLLDLLRASWVRLSTGGLDPERLQAFERSAEAEMVQGLWISVPLLTALNLGFWLTDAWVFQDVPGVAGALAVLRGILVGFAVLALLAVVLFRRRASLVPVLGGIATCFSIAATFAHIGGPSTPWFHFLYPFALSPIAWYLGPKRRVLVMSLFGLALVGGYFGSRPEHLLDPMARCALAHFSYIELIGISAGIYLDRIRLRSWTLQQDLERERSQLADRVAEQTSDLRRLARRLDEVQELERKHLSRELHDELGQTLTALRIALKVTGNRWAGEPGSIGANLKQIGTLLDDLTEQTRRILRDLRPPALEDLGLGAALEWLAEQMPRRGGPACTLDLPPGRVEVSSDQAGVAYRCVQEALTNVTRHARAQAVHLRVGVEEAELRVVIEDDGVGMGLGPTQGLGLLGMRERVAAVGGQLAIASAPGRGTRLTVALPIGAAP